MKRLWLVLALALGGGVVVLSSVAARYEERVRPGTTIAGVAVGGKTAKELGSSLESWWRDHRDDELTFEYEGRSVRQSWSDAGIALRHEETLRQVPMSGFWDNLLDRFQTQSTPQDVTPVLGLVKVDRTKLRELVENGSSRRSLARVRFVNGQFSRVPEESGMTLDERGLDELVLDAAWSGRTISLPVVARPKKVEDAALERITTVVAEFTTKFNAGQTDRSSNIALAASKIDGVVLSPGEKFSFNGVVGKRTTRAGYRIAGVYVNGRHDFDLGGGICQVSTTLYNAVLLANLKITSRQNHSMPVPYVPVGQDATVDFGKIDLQFENNLPGPIAVSSTVEKGKITFRVLGEAAPDGEVAIERTDLRSWSLPAREVQDPSLPAGKRKVVEKGSPGYSVHTFRVVRRGGEEVSREPLGKSHYRGGSRIIHVGTMPAEALPETEPTVAPEPLESQV